MIATPKASRFAQTLLALALGQLALLIFSTDASAETWFGYRGGVDGNKSRTSDPTPDLSTAWSTGDTMLVPGGGCVSYSDGNVFTSIGEFNSYKSGFAAFDAGTGELLWQKEPGWLSNCPTPHGDSVLVVDQRASDYRMVLARLDAEDGTLIWEHVLPGSVEFKSPEGVTVADGKVFTFTRDFRTIDEQLEVRAFDLEDGEELWRRPGIPTGLPPIVEAGTVIVYNFDSPTVGTLAYDTDDGTPRGWVGDSNPDLSRSVLFGGVLYYKLEGRYVRARNMTTGEVIWTRDLGESFQVQDLLADDDGLYVSLQKGSTPPRLVGLDLDDGSDLWPFVSLTGLNSQMLMLNGQLYFGSGTPGERAIVDPDSGEVVGSASGFPNNPYSGFAYGDGSFYLWRSFQHPSGVTAGELVANREVTPPQMTFTGPGVGPYQSTAHQLTWTATDGTGVGIDRFEVFLNGELQQTLPAESRGYGLTGLAAGPNQVTLVGYDLKNNKATLTRSVFVDPSPEPVAGMPILTELMLSGQEYEFDGSLSRDTVLDGGIARYEWDIDGDGEFETDAGANPIVKVRPERVGNFEVSLQVTNLAGNSATSKRMVAVRRSRLPGADQPGLTINDAAVFTNDPEVELKISWPEYAEFVTVSNDGGFDSSQAKGMVIPEDGTITWKLTSSGPERLPKQVYLRFYGTTSDAVVYTDDIILDETPPVIDQASPVGDGAVASVSARRKPKKFKLKLRARDSNSGIIAFQAAKTPKVRGPVIKVGGRVRRLQKRVDPRVPYKPRLVRVQDAAGNWSKLRKIR